MGTMTFLLPPDLDAGMLVEFARAYVAGGMENMPWPTEIRVHKGKLLVKRTVNESGSLCVPWAVPGAGRIMLATATLMERDEPYHLAVELARGRVNLLRAHAADWQMYGLQILPELKEKLDQAGLAFARAACQQEDLQSAAYNANHTLAQSLAVSNDLVRTYIGQVLFSRQQRQPRLEGGLSCGVSNIPDAEQTRLLREAFNTIRLDFSWPRIEPAESTYHWEPYDELVQWAKDNTFRLTAGPLVDFSRSQLPDWLWLWEKDPASLAGFMADYVRTAVERYHQDIRVWQITAGSNWASILSLVEDDFLQLTAQLLVTARRVDPDLDLGLGLTQPWGEYAAQEDRAYSPFVFADTLIRSDLGIKSLDVELVTGVQPRGSYPRDLLEVSRILDLYAGLGVPMRVTLGCPSATGPDALADAELQIDTAGGAVAWSSASQHAWITGFLPLAVCKPYVQEATWVHLSDRERHAYPHCGLFDQQGRPKPGLEYFKRLRDSYFA